MMALVHKVDSGNAASKEPSIWLKIQQFLDIMPHRFEDPDKQARYQQLSEGDKHCAPFNYIRIIWFTSMDISTNVKRL